MTSPVAGWYADPAGGRWLRWWSGNAWTDHVREFPPPAEPAHFETAPYVAHDFRAGTTTKSRGIKLTRSRNERELRANNGWAWTGLLFSLLAFLLNTFAIPGLLGIIFSSIGVARASRLASQGARVTGRGYAIAGLVIGVSLTVVFFTRLSSIL